MCGLQLVVPVLEYDGHGEETAEGLVQHLECHRHAS